ncbi:hypothetical protein MSAN_00836700 [Mycena sanguinolenta]|uniref:F-box domain-containing protein n=1 Tax=Mycena sanguinolenta TaxID=230812 RepID=A0A8H6YV77_9AGAR|nr:hypothetical protein MSAN_00836700 [Mycena sanguinolenta]
MFEFLPNAVSPFADKLGTNDVPSDEEIAHLRDFLVGPTEQLAKIQAQIDEMELVVGQLKAKRESLQTDIDAHKALISPMRRVPEDVLREIFVACLPTTHIAVIDIAEAPLLLGRICKRWRVVAYSTPMLWTSIHIAPLRSCGDRGMAGFFPQLQPVIEQWLERGTPRPLTVSLVERDCIWSDPEFYATSLLRNFLHRLSHLSLCGDIRLLLPLLRLGPESLPLLENIYIIATGTVPFTEYPDAMNLLQLPSITTMTLRVMANPLSLPLKWSQLTDLSLQCSRYSLDSTFDGVAALEVLRRCPSLFRCQLVLNSSRDDASLTSNASLITLPSLHSLFLGETNSWSTKFPRLYGSCIGVFINTNHFTQPGLLELLQSFPLICHLIFSSIHITAALPDDQFLLHLASKHDICPMLTHVCVTSYCSDTAALAFVKGRMASPTPLQFFGAQFLRTMQVDIMPELQTFTSAGLQVFLNYTSPHFDARAGLPIPEA